MINFKYFLVLIKLVEAYSKIYNNSMYTQIIIKKIYFFFSLQYIRLSGKNINFDDKKIKKTSSTKTK